MAAGTIAGRKVMFAQRRKNLDACAALGLATLLAHSPLRHHGRGMRTVFCGTMRTGPIKPELGSGRKPMGP